MGTWPLVSADGPVPVTHFSWHVLARNCPGPGVIAFLRAALPAGHAVPGAKSKGAGYVCVRKSVGCPLPVVGAHHLVSERSVPKLTKGVKNSYRTFSFLPLRSQDASVASFDVQPHSRDWHHRGVKAPGSSGTAKADLQHPATGSHPLLLARPSRFLSPLASQFHRTAVPCSPEPRRHKLRSGRGKQRVPGSRERRELQILEKR